MPISELFRSRVPCAAPSRNNETPAAPMSHFSESTCQPPKGQGGDFRNCEAPPKPAPSIFKKLNCALGAGPRSQFKYRRRGLDRKSTRLNSSHVSISYAVFCLKKKKKTKNK